MTRAGDSPEGDPATSATEFVYRIRRADGARPGAHPGRGLGAGDEFAGHRRLFDAPDPRRLDVRASLASVPREWRVRTHRRRAAVTLRAIVDVSASMRSGAKLDVAAALLGALGRSAFRAGDAVALEGFDAAAVGGLSRAPRLGRGAGEALVAALAAERAGPGRAGSLDGLADCLARTVSPAALTFVVSDFHFALDALPRAVERARGSRLCPVVVWSPAETEPPPGSGWVALVDSESGRRRRTWLRASTRQAWREAVSRRRAEIERAFEREGLAPFRIEGAFDAEALSRHLLETGA